MIRRWFAVAALAGFATLFVPGLAFSQITGSTDTQAASRGSAGEYLSDLLKKPAYRESWNRLIQGQGNAERWLREYASTFDGPTTPSATLVLSDGEYLITTVCQAHNCGPTLFYVLFSPDGAQAWGIQRKQREPATVFGQPDSEKERAVREFMLK